MRNDAYWTERMKILEDSLLNTGYEYVQNLEEQFDRAIHDIESQMSAWYQRFAKNNDISLAEARRLLTTQELKEFRWTVKEYIKYGQENAVSQAWMKQLENASARVHISRLDSLKLQLQQRAEALHEAQSEATEKALTDIYRRGYYHTAFEIQKGLGVGWSLQGLTDSAIKKVLSRPWTTDDRTFSDRIWQNKQSLIGSVNTQLTQMIMRGQAPDKAIKAIADRFAVSKRQAGRLVMTESAAFSSMAQKDCYNELDVEEYRVIATLDSGTCELCGELDNKVYKMSEYVTGTTAPPFHPWCRCCTAPYFADMEDAGDRFARDAKTGERFEVPGNMNYQQWKAMQDKLHGGGTVDTERKKSYNASADRAQYESYKSRLGDDAPKTFADFQELKYNRADDWDDLKYYYRNLNGRPIEYVKIDRELEKAGITGKGRAYPVKKLYLKGWRGHAENRLRQSGLSKSEALGFMDSAVAMMKQYPNPNTLFNYYSDSGVIGVKEVNCIVQTVIGQDRFQEDTRKILEVMKKWLK